MNLLGHELASCIVECAAFARLVHRGTVRLEDAIADLCEQYGPCGASPDSVRRELEALLAAPSGSPWTGDSLPIDGLC